jgi:hypothetical protein
MSYNKYPSQNQSILKNTIKINADNPNFINTLYDPTKYNPQQNQKIYQPAKTNNPNAVESNNVKIKQQTPQQIMKISEKIYNHFKSRYPETINASGFSINTISEIINHTTKRNNASIDEKLISKIIDIIEHKFKMTINSNNREGTQYDTTSFTMDNDSKISIDKYLENYTNKVSILLDSEKAAEAELPKNMGPINDIVKLTKPEPFNEDFPIRDREKQTDMMVPEVRSYDYYITIDSKDRDVSKYPKPNEFVIDFAPAPPADTTDTRRGYIDRGFGNIKACELMNVIIRDTSSEPDASDAGGISFPYLLLQFDELQNNFFGTNNNISRTFAILADYSKIGNYKYYRLFGDTSENTISRVYNPRINLNKITTRLLLPDGSPFNFGSSFINDTSNTCITISFRFTTIQKNLATQFIDKATY